MEQIGGVEDSASTGGYLLVAQAVDLVDELLLTGSGVADVGVGVAEGRYHHTALCVNYFILWAGHRALGHIPETRDSFALDREVSVPQGADLVHLGALLAQNAFRNDSDQFADVGDYGHLMNSIDFWMSGCI